MTNHVFYNETGAILVELGDPFISRVQVIVNFVEFVCLGIFFKCVREIIAPSGKGQLIMLILPSAGFFEVLLLPWSRNFE